MDTVRQLQPTPDDPALDSSRINETATDTDQDDSTTDHHKPTASSQALIPLPPSASSTSTKPTSDQKILSLLRASILPFSDRLDPFAALPVSLDRLQEHLVSFYLLHYPKVTYGFSPLLRPHPVATNFSIALTTPACFQVILARSALYRLSLSKYAGEKEKKALEVVMMRHKGEALRLIRVLSAKSSPTRKDDLIASIISLGTLDKRTGSNDAAGMHFMAVRRILKATGGPLAVRSLLLSRVMVFFETIYGTPTESYIWDTSDLTRLMGELNAFLARVWGLWKHNSAMAGIRRREGWYQLAPSGDSTSSTSAPSHIVPEQYLQPSSDLRTILSRSPGPTESSDATPILPQHRLELISQVTCLLTLAAVILDYENLPPSARASTFATHEPTSASTKQPPSSASTTTRTSCFPSVSHRSSTSSTGSGGRRRSSVLSTTTTTTTRPPLKPAPHPSSSSTTTTTTTTSTSASTSGIPDPSTSTSIPDQPHSHSHSHQHHPPLLLPKPPPPPLPQPSALHTYLSALHTSISTLSLLTHPTTNTLWQIQIADHSHPHSARVWRAASFAWVLKHVGWNVQREIAGWLRRFLEGRDVDGKEISEEERRGGKGKGKGKEDGENSREGQQEREKLMKLNSFHFSYAA